MTAHLLTVDELAAALRVPRKLVLESVRGRAWPHVRFSRKTIRFTPEHVDRIVAMHQVAVVAEPRGLPGQTRLSVARATR